MKLKKQFYAGVLSIAVASIISTSGAYAYQAPPIETNVQPSSIQQATDIRPMAIVTWNDEEIPYNGEMGFLSNQPGGYWRIAKGVRAVFKASFDDNHHVEVGFQYKNGNRTVLNSGKMAGFGTWIEPTETVEGYFYIKNNAAGDIMVNNASLEY